MLPAIQPPSLLHSTVILAMSADGKIADRDRTAARFSSRADLAHLETQIAAADAVLIGGGTLRAYGTTLPVRRPSLVEQRQQRGQPEQPMHIIWSPSGNLDPGCRFFQQAVPRGLLTTAAAAEFWRTQGGFEQVWAVSENPWNWHQAMELLHASSIGRLAVLGGGRLVAELLKEQLVQELFLTLCPLLLGGETAPTPVDGLGFLATAAPQLQLISCEIVDQEIFLHYRVEAKTLPSENS
ncbi:MAG TPA: RibD family protein [Trichocoleus sp.]